MNELNRSQYLNDIEYFSRKVEADPSSKLFMPLAVALLKLNKYDDVIYYCAQGLEHYPDFAAAKTVMAQAYMGKGRVEDAKGLLKQVILLNRFNYKANKLMGDIYRSEQDNARALEYYEKAWEISPEDKRLKDDIDELRTRSEDNIETVEVELPEDETALSEVAAEEIAAAVREDLAEYDFDESVKELAEDEAEQTLAEIAAREAEQEAEADEGFDMDSIRSEDFEEEIKVSLINSVKDKIGVEIVPLEAEEFVEEENEAFVDIKDDEPIELGSFADEVNRAEEEAVMSVISGIAAVKVEQTGAEPLPQEELDDLGGLSYEDFGELEEPETAEELDAFAEVPQNEDLEASFEEPVAEETGITDESEATEAYLEEELTAPALSYGEDDGEYTYAAPDYEDEGENNIKYDDEYITSAGDDFITERLEDESEVQEETESVTGVAQEPFEAEVAEQPAPEIHKSPQEKLAEAKKLMAEAQIEALEQALFNIKKNSQKDKYLAGSDE